MKRLERQLSPRLDGSTLRFSLSLSTAGEGGGGGTSTLAIGVAVSGMLAAIAIPAFMKYQRRSKTTEALVNLRRISDGAIRYYGGDSASGGKRRPPHRFPPSVDWTPATSPCDHPNGQFPPRPHVWRSPAWSALGFSLESPAYYSYKFESSGAGEGANFTASARGDLNCDGNYSLFQRVGTVKNGVVVGTAGLYTQNEIE